MQLNLVLCAMRAILVGGTSHVGKSTFGSTLASRLGWDAMSTDKFARHPGRPWRDEGDVPSEIRKYFSTCSSERMLEEVIQHYEKIVWPIAESVLRARILNPYDNCVVLEGSAVLPDCVATSALAKSRAVWLTVPDDVIVTRIRESSGYEDRSAPDRLLIDKFQSRALAFNQYLLKSATSLEMLVIDVANDKDWDRSLEDLISEGSGA